jgi:prevent-host-death family protein
MRSVNIQQAKTHLSRLLEEAASGEEIVIAKAGKPYVRLVPYVGDDSPRKLGSMRGDLWIAPDFDCTPDEIVALFEGNAPRATRKRARR